MLDDPASFARARFRVSGSETVANVRDPPASPMVYSNVSAFLLSSSKMVLGLSSEQASRVSAAKTARTALARLPRRSHRLSR